MNIKFKENSNGFSAIISGVDKNLITTKVNECKDGNCSCNCDIEIMNKIENVEVLEIDGKTEIKITGEVTKEMLAPMMEECLIK